MASPWIIERHNVFLPHPLGTFIRIYHGRRTGHKYPNRLISLYGGATCLRCAYCYSFWARGKWNGEDYRLDMRTGWWEYDDGSCFCIYFDSRRNVIEPGESLFIRHFYYGRFMVCDECDVPTDYGVRGKDVTYDWEDVIAVKAFNGLKNIGVPKWRSKNCDCLGQFLSMKTWTRLRKTCASYVDGIWTLTELSLSWLTVRILYTKEQQLHYDEASDGSGSSWY